MVLSSYRIHLALAASACGLLWGVIDMNGFVGESFIRKAHGDVVPVLAPTNIHLMRRLRRLRGWPSLYFDEVVERLAVRASKGIANPQDQFAQY